MIKSVLITQERQTISVTIKTTFLPQVWFCILNPSVSAFYQLGASVLSPGTRHDQWRRYKQETELVSVFFFMRPGRDETISVSDTNQSTSTNEILDIYHVSSFIYLLDTPNPPLVSTLTQKFPHRLPGEVWHSRGHDYEIRLQNTEIWLFVD